MLKRNARYSVVKLAMLCGPITRRGRSSPTTQSIRYQPVVAHLLDLGELGMRPAPDRSDLAVVHATLLCLRGQVSDCGRTLAGHQGAVLVLVGRVPAREHRGPGELRIDHLVVVKAPLLEELVPHPHRATVEPPLLTPEDQVAAGDVSDTCGLGAVAVVQRHRDGLRRDEAVELGVSSELLVPVQRIGVVHRHHPATDVRGTARIPQLPPADPLAHAMIDIAQIELCCVGYRVSCHFASPTIDGCTVMRTDRDSERNTQVAASRVPANGPSGNESERDLRSIPPGCGERMGDSKAPIPPPRGGPDWGPQAALEVRRFDTSSRRECRTTQYVGRRFGDSRGARDLGEQPGIAPAAHGVDDIQLVDPVEVVECQERLLDLAILEKLSPESARQEAYGFNGCESLSADLEHDVRAAGLGDLAPLVPEKYVAGLGVGGQGPLVDFASRRLVVQEGVRSIDASLGEREGHRCARLDVLFAQGKAPVRGKDEPDLPGKCQVQSEVRKKCFDLLPRDREAEVPGGAFEPIEVALEQEIPLLRSPEDRLEDRKITSHGHESCTIPTPGV